MCQELLRHLGIELVDIFSHLISFSLTMLNYYKTKFIPGVSEHYLYMLDLNLTHK